MKEKRWELVIRSNGKTILSLNDKSKGYPTDEQVKHAETIYNALRCSSLFMGFDAE